MVYTLSKLYAHAEYAGEMLDVGYVAHRLSTLVVGWSYPEAKV